MKHSLSLSIHERENRLFREWVASYPEIDPKIFQFDGLHHTGTVSKESGSWQMVPDGMETMLWEASARKIVVLVKDYNMGTEGEAVDSRLDTGLDNRYEKPRIAKPFHYTLASMLYGVFAIGDDYEPPTLEEIEDEANCLSAYHSKPFVRLNTKKIGGSGDCEGSLLRQHVNKDKAYIRHQISFYTGANIFIVGDGYAWTIERHGDNAIMDFIHELFPDLRPYKSDPDNENTWIYYSQKENVVILHMWHPSRHQPSDEYPGIVELANFLKDNPGFLIEHP